MKYFKFLSRFVLGVVFIFSGFVKAVDPLGSAYKFSDYFIAFKLDFLEFSALPLSIFLSAFELVLGITLLLGYRRRIVYWILMWFMAFFTLITFVLAIFDPVSDCGCFGDALILTNWQTFLKNLVLMIFVLALYLG
ncbi:MAG: DoxX family membrane protein, partial [Bacteroidales bacterium]|nr:DoxX family membrane protein [Bacteroidales bacterium]